MGSELRHIAWIFLIIKYFAILFLGLTLYSLMQNSAGMTLTVFVFYLICDGYLLHLFYELKTLHAPLICISRKHQQVGIITKNGEFITRPWDEIQWYFSLTHVKALSGPANTSYSVRGAIRPKLGEKRLFSKKINISCELDLFFAYSTQEDKKPIYLLEGYYNFIHYYMRYGAGDLKVPCNTATDLDRKENNLLKGTVLLPPSLPYEGGPGYFSKKEMWKDLLWRFFIYPVSPKALWELKPRRKEIPEEFL